MIRRSDLERLVGQGAASYGSLSFQIPTSPYDPFDWPEEGSQKREGVDADIEEGPRAFRVKALGIRVPRLYPVPVHLRVNQAHLADGAIANELPGGLLPLTQKCERAAAQPES